MFQFLPSDQQLSKVGEEVLVEELVEMSDNPELDNEKNEKFNTEQEAVEEVKASEWPVEEPVKKVQSPSEKVNIDNEADVIKEQKEVVTKKIEETVVDEVQTVLGDSDLITVETENIVNENVQETVKDNKIHSKRPNMHTSKTEKQTEVPNAEEIQPPLEDLRITETETKKEAVEKQVELTLAQEMQTGSEETEILLNTIDKDFSEEHSKHAAEEIHSGLNEILTIETQDMQDNGNAEQESGTAVKDIQISSDEMDFATNGNVDDQISGILTAEIEQETEEELIPQLTKESGV